MTFPGGGSEADPLTSLTVTGEQLTESQLQDETFYLAQSATVDIYGWFLQDGRYDWHFIYADPAPGHNITRTDIRDEYDNWQGYVYQSTGVTGSTATETFTLTLRKLDTYTSTSSVATWTFHIMPSGTIDPSVSDTSERYIEDIYAGRIFMSDLYNKSQYLIYQADSNFNCVESYTVYGGCEQPFEYIQLKVNKKQLVTLAPVLAYFMVPGRNIITLFGPGQGQYVVTKCKKDDNTWTLTAYSIMEQMRSISTYENKPLTGTTPLDMIENLLRQSTLGYVVKGTDPRALVRNVKHYVRKAYNVWLDTESRMFPKGSNYWYVIQVCALRLNAKVWMADGIMYIIDTSLTGNEDSNEVESNFNGNPFTDLDTIYLNTQGGFPIDPTPDQINVLENVVSTPELGDDGVTVIRNKFYVGCTDNNGNDITVQSSDVLSGNSYKSQQIFNQKSYSLTLSELGLQDAGAIANLMAGRYCDAETSITFKMRETTEVTVTENGETVTKRYWRPFFGPLTRIRNIVDFANETTVSVRSNLDDRTVMLNKGMLSRYETEFPKFVTTYTFAMSVPTDATQNNSEILAALKNG